MDIVPILIGPTAVGKTAVSLQIAKQLPVEIISADSRQIYRHLDIGTAKPESETLKRINHHFISSISPRGYFNAGMFGRQARKIVIEILKMKKIPLVVGGSGLYIQAFVDGLSEINGIDESIRGELQKRWDEQGAEQLYAELKKVDLPLAIKLHPKDKQRVLRGLEVYYTSGSRLSDVQQISPQPAPFTPLMAGIIAEREFLYEQINHRVDHMIKQGLVEEVRELKKKGYDKQINALNTVGYKEVFDYLDNKLNHEEMVEEIKKNSRRYAKRQLTWFRRDKRIKWFNVNEFESLDHLAKNIQIYYQKSLNN